MSRASIRTLSRTLAAVILIATLAPQPLSASTPARLVRQIDGDPQFAAVVNGVVLFFTNDEEHGRELWRSDGTVEGTRLVRDIRPGPESGIGYGYGGSVLFDGALAFSASDGQGGGAQLWRSDGTEAGTVLVRDTQPGIADARARLFTPVGDRLWFMVATGFFTEDRGTDDLWTTDLTKEGTQRLSQLGYWTPGFSGGPAEIVSLTPFKEGALVARVDRFECCESISLRVLDAVGMATTSLYSRDGGHLVTLYPPTPLAGTETGYFTTQDSSGTLNCNLWRTDGIGATRIDVETGCAGKPLAVLGDDLLLSKGLEANRPLQIYRATPMDAGLSFLADLGEASLTEYEGGLVTTSGGLFFSVRRNDADELWRAESTTEAPSLVHRFAVGEEGRYLRTLTAVDVGVVFWISDLEGGGDTLWESTGSPESTRPIGFLPMDVRSGAVIANGSRFFLWGYDAENGPGLWVIDRGTRAPECAGDCDSDGSVSVADLVVAVRIALGLGSPGLCPFVDTNSDLQVSIDEIVASVSSLLHGCPEEPN